MGGVETVLVLVVLATVVAASAHRLRVPAPSLLVLAGLVVGLVPGVPTVQVTPEAVGLVVLPPLLYAASEELSWRDLRAVWRPVAVLAIGLVLASAAVVAVVATAVTPLPASMAFVLGAVLASTDPVAVTALGRRLPLPARVQALVQAESLFNDATSLVLFRVAVSIAVAGGTVAGAAFGGPASWAWAVGQFVLLAGGGVLAGATVAAGVAAVRRRTEDPVLETVIALVTPYAAYVAAEVLHVSGVTAVIVAGVILATQAVRLSNADIRLQLHAVYGTVVFLLEAVVFSLIGLELPALLRESEISAGDWPVQAMLITGVLLAMRVLWVFPLSAMLARRGGGRPSWRVSAVVVWAGSRGVLPLAAALSIPLADAAGGPLAGRDLVLLLTTAVIVFTLVVQGFTLAPLVRRSGVALAPEHARNEDTTARLRMAQAALGHVEELAEAEAAPEVVLDGLRRGLQVRIGRARLNADAGSADGGPAGGGPPVDGRAAGAQPDGGPTYRELRRDLIAVESAELTRLYETGEIGADTRKRLQRLLDLEDAGLSGGI
ncbi:MAG TPA: sodium:proton antiporter [Mycobacteriales bacterium]|nr:sodium:proton antiporter [Mycobacteriales bacterium]